MTLPAVADAEIDFDRKTATVTARPGLSLSRAGVAEALERAGYGVTTFETLSAGGPSP